VCEYLTKQGFSPNPIRDAWKDSDNPKFNAIVFKEMIIEE
jgi:hypothetical protein